MAGFPASSGTARSESKELSHEQFPGPSRQTAVKTLGVDLAAATRKTAAAVLEWSDGTARTGLIPLSVSADRLAHPAMRCAVIQAKIARAHGPQSRDGSGRLAEVHPAASLESWGLLARGYKGPGGAQTQRLAGLRGPSQSG